MSLKALVIKVKTKSQLTNDFVEYRLHTIKTSAYTLILYGETFDIKIIITYCDHMKIV